MRVGLIISVIVHVMIFMWIMVSPGQAPFDPARTDAVLVDLVSPNEVPPLAEPEPAEPETAKSEVPAFEPPKPEPKRTPLPPVAPTSPPRRAEPPKAAPAKAERPKPVLEADHKPPPKPETAATPSAEDQAASAPSFAWMLNLPPASLNGAGGLPSETGTKLTSDEIAKLKARVSQCWVGPGAPAAPDEVLIRLRLKPNGALRAEPEPRALPQFPSDPLLVIRLVESATRALQQCQPYDFLPADKYEDWKGLELGFSAAGPSDLRIPALDSSVTR